jgi:hypothetical protein
VSRRAFWLLATYFGGLFVAASILAFTLPEASIVLVICGALIGCILAAVVIEP